MIATILPLIFLKSPSRQALDKPWTTLNIPYAYWRGNSTDINGTFNYAIAYEILFNISINTHAGDNLADTRFEYYQFQLYTDKQPIFNFTYGVCTNYSKVIDTHWLESYTLLKPFNNISIDSGKFIENQAKNSTIVSLENFAGTSESEKSAWERSYSDIWQQSTDYQWLLATQNANVINIDLSRLGYLTVKGNSTITTLTSNDVIQHVQLTKYGNGFLYNDIPNDQLSKINIEIPVSK